MRESKFIEQDLVVNKYNEVTATYQMNVRDQVVRASTIPTGSAFDLILPSVSAAGGKNYSIKMGSKDGIKNITIKDNGDSDNWIDIVLLAANDIVLLHSDGMMWHTSNVLNDVSGQGIITIRSNQTIQSVIDACPVAEGSLTAGYTNPYILKVPPGHEKEYFSLVRNASDVASDKRNVKVVFEDSPKGIFKLDQWDACDSLINWSAYFPGTVIALDDTHHTEGSHGFKITKDDGNSGVERVFPAPVDLREYQGIVLDFDADDAEIKGISIQLFDTTGLYITINEYFTHSKGRIRSTIYFPLFSVATDVLIDLSSIDKMVVSFSKINDFHGTSNAYIDNFRLMRTTPYRTIILRFDDSTDEHWNVATRLLDARGWKGNFLVAFPELLDEPTMLTLAQIKAMDAYGHNIINHTIDHLYFNDLDLHTSIYQYTAMQRFLEHHGINRTSNVFSAPGHKSNRYVKDYFLEVGCVVMDERYNLFPVTLGTCSNPAFAIPVEIQRFVNSGRGGIVQILSHTITNETNFTTLLNWIEENFSEIIVATEVVNRFPFPYRPSTKQTAALATGCKKTLTEDFNLNFWHGGDLILDPGGSARSIIPIKEFRPFHEVRLINTADAAETLTFDPTFTSAGNHDGGNNELILADSGESWIPNRLVGRTINNTPDGSSGVITSNTATTITAPLIGGTDNDWDTNDAYTITPVGLNEAVAQNNRGIFVYDGAGWLKIYVGS